MCIKVVLSSINPPISTVAWLRRQPRSNNGHHKQGNNHFVAKLKMWYRILYYPCHESIHVQHVQRVKFHSPI